PDLYSYARTKNELRGAVNTILMLKKNTPNNTIYWDPEYNQSNDTLGTTGWITLGFKQIQVYSLLPDLTNTQSIIASSLQSVVSFTKQKVPGGILAPGFNPLPPAII